MKISETTPITSSQVLANVLCDLCGQSCRVQPVLEITSPSYGSTFLREEEFSYGTLKFGGDYNGKYDGINFDLELCEECTMAIYRRSHNIEPYYRELLGLDDPDSL